MRSTLEDDLEKEDCKVYCSAKVVGATYRGVSETRLGLGFEFSCLRAADVGKE